MPKKILVCGATGFIGRNISEFFSSNPDYEVTGTFFNAQPFENSNINFVYADLTHKSDIERLVEGKDVVIHAAAITSGYLKYNAESDVTDNIVMNSLMIQSCFDAGVGHFLYPSCTIVYPSSFVPVNEGGTCLPGTDSKYFLGSRMKSLAEDMCLMFSLSKKCFTKFTLFRHSNIYGPFDKYDLAEAHVCAASIAKILNANTDDIITVYGSGEDSRDLLYVDDLVRFIDTCIDKQKSTFELFNVGYGSGISIKSLCHKIAEISGKNVKIQCEKQSESYPPSCVILDCSKAKSLLGWEPTTTLNDGLRQTIDWYIQTNKNIEKDK